MLIEQDGIAVRVQKKLEGQLTSVYATDPKKVDRFFKPFRKRRKDKKTDG